MAWKLSKTILVAGFSLALTACLPSGSQAEIKAPTGQPAQLAANVSLAAPQIANSLQSSLPDFANLVEQVGPAVVNISVSQQVSRRIGRGGPFGDDPFYDFLRRFGIQPPDGYGDPEGGDQQGNQGGQGNNQDDGNNLQPSGIGSGFIISADGYVLTNAHVVDKADEVTVKLTDKREFKAKVIGADKRTDVALLKVEAKDLPTVKTGNPDTARVGEWVVAMGSPFGFENSVTSGIISAKARRLPDETYVPFIQTDVAINPGNSGGPLFNLKGEVIGINSQIYSRSGGYQGISFAIPIDVAMRVRGQLQEFGVVKRGRLGVVIQSLSKELADSFGLKTTDGALVSSVENNSPASKAGLKSGDVVLAVNGEHIAESSDLPSRIGNLRPGTKVELTIWRERAAISKTIALGSQDETGASGSASAQSSGGDKKLIYGMSLRALTTEEADSIGVRGGVIIEKIDSKASRSGLRTGDVILALNNVPVASPEDFRKLAERAGSQFAVLVQRGNLRLFIPMRIG